MLADRLYKSASLAELLTQPFKALSSAFSARL